MPNWVMNRVYVRGDEGDFFKRIKDGMERDSDFQLFNEFVPRPECYDFDTTNYRTEGQNPNGFNGHNLLNVGTVIGYGDNAFEVDEEYLEKFRNAEKEQEKYGSIGWYDWNVSNWGTKWDAEYLFARGDYLTFETAWSYPDEFFRKVSKLYPKARFYVIYADEDIGSNCGGVVWENGHYSDLDINALFAEVVWDFEEGFENHVSNTEDWRG